MISGAVTLVIAAFLSGAVIAVFVILVVAIHAGDRAHRLTDPPHSRLQALTRSLLGVGVRTCHFSGNQDGGKD
jgi:RsiW-degrading membrane proteinase PrsW (M82 family)